MSSGLLVAALLACPVAAAVLVLPGFALRSAHDVLVRRTRLPRWIDVEGRDPADEPPAAGIILALGLSLCFVTVVGGALLAFGAFTPTRLAVVTALAAALGVVPFVRWCLGCGWSLPAHVALVLALAAPISISVFGSGYRPAQSYQWFYWNLGRQLSAAQGIPDHVVEWGRAVRWQPDYLNFNIVSQAYMGMMGSVPDPTAVAVWRLPLAVSVLAMVYLVLRLWFGRIPAAAGAAVLSATDFYIGKVGNNSPEALGLALGLVSVWLMVQAIRLERRSWLMLGSITIALTVSVHGIAAAVCGMLAVAAVLVELMSVRATLSRWVPTLLVGSATSALVVTALGQSLQGRSSPLGDAGNPARVGDNDPTYEFIQYSNGNFDPPATDDGLGLLGSAWPAIDFISPHWSWVVLLVPLVLVACLVLQPGRSALGALTALLFVLILGAAIAWFQLSYDTFVPRHTGNSRMVQYAPLVYVLPLAGAIELLLDLLSRWSRPSLRRWTHGIVAVLLAGAFLGVAAPATARTMDTRPRVSPTGDDALAALKSEAPRGAVVVSNVATRGTLEFFTGLEAPSEGRQPLIEDLGTLTSATRYLRRLNDYLVDPEPGQLREALGANWIILARSPRALGTGLSYGEPAPEFARKADLETVWRDGNVRILRTAGDTPDVAPVGPRKLLWSGFLVWLVGLVGVCLAMTRAVRNLSGPSHKRRATRWWRPDGGHPGAGSAV